MKQELALQQLVDTLEQFNMDRDSEEYCTVRHFSISGRKVVNRGDSFKVKRSTSGNSVASLGSSGCEVVESPCRSPAPSSNPPYKVVLLGAQSVGKSSLISQFMTSDFLHAYENYNSERSEKTVTVLLDGEEAELTFTDLPYAILKRREMLDSAHGFCVVYSVTDRSSFHQAELFLQQLATDGTVDRKAVILVANKVDLVRNRVVTEPEGRILATACNCKFIESSVVINHNVDELLVGLLTQIRLRMGVEIDVGKKKRRKFYRGSKTSSSFRGLLSKLRISKSHSCNKLHEL